MPPPPQGPVQMAVGPGLLCKAGSPKAGQQRNNKMDSLLLKTRKLATSHGCQSLQPIEGRQHQGKKKHTKPQPVVVGRTSCGLQGVSVARLV
ncbi:uncharacterized protein LOC135320871 isoform X5 [Camelus dromedarius]|uniref:Uncharacterized protein LOC141577079 isoform X6 n=1 Tax=Camelus bactrianus TaxID=9837 RepID=A0AC58Q390_CAMBA